MHCGVTNNNEEKVLQQSWEAANRDVALPWTWLMVTSPHSEARSALCRGFEVTARDTKCSCDKWWSRMCSGDVPVPLGAFIRRGAGQRKGPVSALQSQKPGLSRKPLFSFCGETQLPITWKLWEVWVLQTISSLLLTRLDEGPRCPRGICSARVHAWLSKIRWGLPLKTL